MIDPNTMMNSYNQNYNRIGMDNSMNNSNSKVNNMNQPKSSGGIVGIGGKNKKASATNTNSISINNSNSQNKNGNVTQTQNQVQQVTKPKDTKKETIILIRQLLLTLQALKNLLLLTQQTNQKLKKKRKLSRLKL
jgi:hypothetical protein